MKFSIVLAALIWFISINCGYCHNKVYTVTDNGAVADGRTDDSSAFLQTWRNACGTSGGVVYIPRGTYYVSGARFEGPCNGETYFQNDGYVIASSDIEVKAKFWLLFWNVDGLVIYGQGSFDGNGENTWKSRDRINTFPPISINLEYITNSFVRGITSRNSKTFHIGLHKCGDVQIDHIVISAPENSPNTDGIHIGKSHDIKITNSHISTGDDCISIGDGSRNINVSGVWCGPGHGISIGSLGKYLDEEDVSGITVRDCNLTNTMNGLRIKTLETSIALTVSDVTFSNIHLDGVENPVVIDQYYCPHSSCSHAGESSIQIEDVKFIDIKGSSSKEVGVNVMCSKDHPCQRIMLEGLHITMANGQSTMAHCSNADGRFVGGNQIPSSCWQGNLNFS